MNKFIFIAVILVTAVFLGIYFYSNVSIIGKAVKNSKNLPSATSNVVVTRESLASYLPNLELIKDLPKDASILLKLYSMKNGERVWEESYVIGKGKVYKDKSENADAVISLDSKYVSQLWAFCSTLQKALNNGEASFELKKSQASLLWKYKGVLKYKSCFGW